MVLPYNRIMLSPVLAGEKDFDEIRTHDEAYFAQNNSFNPLAASSPSKPVPITATFLDFPASDCIYSTIWAFIAKSIGAKKYSF
jgi:hypothetical protein